MVQWLGLRVSGFKPWSAKIPRAAEQLGPCATTAGPMLWSPRATTTEPARLEPVLCNNRSHRNKKPVHHNEEWPLLTTTRQSPRAATKTQCSQKNPQKTKTQKQTKIKQQEGFYAHAQITKHFVSINCQFNTLTTLNSPLRTGDVPETSEHFVDPRSLY